MHDPILLDEIAQRVGAGPSLSAGRLPDLTHRAIASRRRPFGHLAAELGPFIDDPFRRTHDSFYVVELRRGHRLRRVSMTDVATVFAQGSHLAAAQRATAIWTGDGDGARRTCSAALCGMSE